MSVATIIVNYNTAALVIDQLEHVRAEIAKIECSHIYIVDNASPAGDLQTLEQATASMEDVTIIGAPRNGGFSYGNNRGFERAMADRAYDYCLMLNPDAYPRPGCLETLTEFMRTHPKAGIVAPRLEGEDGVVQRSAFNFLSARTELLGKAPLGPLFKFVEPHLVAPQPSDMPHQCDWVAGAAALIRTKALEDVGLMDEGYFLYFEEVDHHREFGKAGYEIWYEPQAAAVHLVGQATGIVHGRQGKTAPPEYWYDSRRRYFLKQHGGKYARMADMARGMAFRLQEIKDRTSKDEFDSASDEIRRLKAARARQPSLAD